MAMTLRLSAAEDAMLEQLAQTSRTSKIFAAATAIDLAAPKADHDEFVRTATGRLLVRYETLLVRLTDI